MRRSALLFLVPVKVTVGQLGAKNLNINQSKVTGSAMFHFLGQDGLNKYFSKKLSCDPRSGKVNYGPFNSFLGDL